MRLEDIKETPITVSRSKLKTLLHLAHIGASSPQMRARDKAHPERLTMYHRVRRIERELAENFRFYR